MRKLKILILCYEYPPIGGGGGRVAAQIGEALVARGHEVQFLTAGMKHLPAKENNGGMIIHRIPCFRKREDRCSVFEMALFVACAFFPTLRLIREWRPDILHVHFAVPTGALALPLHWITKVPYILTAHLGDVPGGVPEQTASLFHFLNPFIRPIWKNAAATTAVSSFVADLAGKAYAANARVILNGIATPPPPNLQGHTPPCLLFVGRLSVQKNPLALVKMATQISDLPWKMTIIGEGPLSLELRAAIASADLQDRITLLGWQPTESVRETMLASDILLMPSHSEGLPMVAIEALHCGLAIVGNRIPGLQDVVISGRNGDLCNSADLDSLMADAVRNLMVNSDLLMRYRTESLSLAANFDLAKSAAAYEEVLQRAVPSSTA